ncbi:MAG: sensor domain-containing diguanylate cyclase [Rhodospirillaceae bacterium]
MIVGGYPGPAMLISKADTITLANEQTMELLNEDSSWWDGMTVWRGAARAGLANRRSIQLARPSGHVVYEWQAVRLDGSDLLLLGRDATLERRLRHTLTESRQRYKDLVEISSDFAWETGSDGRLVFVSPRGALGFSAEALINRSLHELVIEDDPDSPLPFDSRRQIDCTELWLRCANGEPAYIQSAIRPLFDRCGIWIGARGVCRDLTEQALRSAELSRIRDRERVLNRIVHTLRDQVDAGKALEVATWETTRALGATGCAIHRIGLDGAASLAANAGDQLESRQLTEVLNRLIATATKTTAGLIEHHDNQLTFLVCCSRFRQTINGSVCIWRDAAAPWDDDARELISGVADRIGITHAQLTYQEHLRHLSERDSLTGLFNRRTFLERLEEMLSWRGIGTSALLYIDLDNFKAVNDLRGHHQGDMVLREVAALITNSIRPGDLAGRMGGDEFVVWLARADEQAAIAMTRRLLVGIAGLRQLSANDERPIGMSVGIAVHLSGQDESIAALIERADSAMYKAKLNCKGNFSIAAGYILDETLVKKP